MENRQQALYWSELVQLKVDCGYIRRYRDNLAATVTRYTVIRAVVSVSALGTWAVVRAYPMLWGGIIAASQIADALQNAMGYTTRLRGATALSFALEALFIDCLMEWEDVFGGKIEANEITKRRHKLMTLRHDADRKYLPTPLPVRPNLLKLAEAEASDYLKTLFPSEAA
jgi:hypothetical protein